MILFCRGDEILLHFEKFTQTYLFQTNIWFQQIKM